MLSARCSRVYLEAEDFLMSNFGKTAADPFDPVTNPNGFVNLGTCVNALLEEELEDYLNGKKFNHIKEWQHYNNLRCYIWRGKIFFDLKWEKLICGLFFQEWKE